MCVCQTHAELVSSRTLVEQLESQLKQASTETRQRDTELKDVMKSRDDALKENERLTAELQLHSSNHAREVLLAHHSLSI